MKLLRALSLCLGFATSLSSPFVFGELLVHEGFDYPPGTLQGRDGGFGWSGPYEDFGGKPAGEVVAPNGNTGFGPGNFARFIQDSYHFRGIDTLATPPEHLNERGTLGVPGTSLWLAVFIQAEEPILPPFFGISLFEDGEEKLFLGRGRAETYGWKIQTQITKTQRARAFSGSYYQPQWVVLRIDFRDDGSEGAQLDRALMFLNPDPAGPVPTAVDAVGEIERALGPMSFNRVRFVGNGHGFRMNDLRIGTTFASVSPAAEAGTLISTK